MHSTKAEERCENLKYLKSAYEQGDLGLPLYKAYIERTMRIYEFFGKDLNPDDKNENVVYLKGK